MTGLELIGKNKLKKNTIISEKKKWENSFLIFTNKL